MTLRVGLLGVPYVTSCWPVSAQGNGRLESVTLRRAAAARGLKAAITWPAASA